MAHVQRLEEMSWTQIRSSLGDGITTVVAATGSTEQYGPHLPMFTDTLLGTAIAEGVVERMGNALRGPTIPFGVSEHHMAFKGTITLDKEAFKTVVKQYAHSLGHHGFETVIMIPSHGGNFGPLREVWEETEGEINGARFLPYTNLFECVAVLNEIAASDGISPEVAGAHAGEVETSMVLSERIEVARMTDAEQGFIGVLDEGNARKLIEQGMTALTDNGILGDARPAVAERGRRYIDAMTDFLVEWISSQLEA